jgi:hypothetical protein
VLDARIEIAGKVADVILLAILAGHAELPAVDGHVDLRHSPTSASRSHGRARLNRRR